MDRIEVYKEVLKEELEDRATVINSDFPDVRMHLIHNESLTDFILIRFGWHEHSYRHHVVFHFQIIDDKIWLHQNNTDVPIGEILAEKGISKSDIVIGFIGELERGLEGYGVA
ncbi:MAG: element excision factor XisI family protein [Bacteroidota bacterium]